MWRFGFYGFGLTDLAGAAPAVMVVLVCSSRIGRKKENEREKGDSCPDSDCEFMVVRAAAELDKQKVDDILMAEQWLRTTATNLTSVVNHLCFDSNFHKFCV